MPEKLIQERTGHCSLEALRMYERTNENQHKAVSSILSATEKKSYIQQMYTGVESSVSHTVAEMHQLNALAQYTPPEFSFQKHVRMHNQHQCSLQQHFLQVIL